MRISHGKYFVSNLIAHMWALIQNIYLYTESTNISGGKKLAPFLQDDQKLLSKLDFEKMIIKNFQLILDTKEVI